MKKNNLKVDVIISYISLVTTVIITFFLTKYQLKFLGKEQYGIIALVNSVIGYISILDLGIGQTVTRYVALYKSKGEKDKLEQLVGNSFKNYIKISLIGIIFGTVIVLNSNNIFPNLTTTEAYLFKTCFVIALFNIILQIPGATFNSVLVAHQKFKFLKLATIVKNITRAIAMIVLLHLGYNVIMIFVVDLIINQAVNLLNFLMVKHSLKVKMNFTKLDKEITNQIKHYSFFVFLGIITDQIFWKTDGIILGMFSTISIVGIYNISAQLVSQYLNFSSTFSGVFLPKLTEMVSKGASKNEINNFFTKASKFQFMIVAMILINYIFLGKQFILLWVGPSMIEAYYFGLVIFIALTVPMFQTTGYQILFAMNKHKFRSIVYLFNAILNLFMSVILFKIIGPMGPALATAIAMFIGNTLIMNIYYKKILELKLIRFFSTVCGRTGIIAILTSGIFIILNNYIIENSFLTLILKAAISNSLYIIGIYFVSLSKEERNKVYSKFKKKVKA
ncbi:oligosaccharide flippase family protein [Clostridium tarantellae]|uniref:Oligosaccharide flippase family protein n=1 Tax=Clostridium tarantellae TaxID=39493 RepID=A0A6I1MN47_9CLOT|nr:oligosaccharide flippase family protein [Clostridium tarantellae]MPQ43537.1 oligosaccharide flippase family protein [Clostridium tarantellae]